MKRTAVVALLALPLLGGCAGSRPRAGEARYSVVPAVDVHVRSPRKAVQANYRPAPTDAPLSGAGDSAR